MKRYSCSLFIACLMTLTTTSSLASVVIQGTRVIYPESAKEVTVKMVNEGRSPLLVQSWLDCCQVFLQNIFLRTNLTFGGNTLCSLCLSTFSVICFGALMRCPFYSGRPFCPTWQSERPSSSALRSRTLTWFLRYTRHCGLSLLSFRHKVAAHSY